jgi:hypothetical protein
VLGFNAIGLNKISECCLQYLPKINLGPAAFGEGNFWGCDNSTTQKPIHPTSQDYSSKVHFLHFDLNRD